MNGEKRKRGEKKNSPKVAPVKSSMNGDKRE